MAGKALIAASGAPGSFHSEVKNGELVITLPEDLVDVALFTDLLNYILPAGMTYHIRIENEIAKTPTTLFDLDEVVLADLVVDLDWDNNTTTTVGLANMFEVGTSEPAFGNYKNNSTEVLNTGLLDNNTIPLIDALDIPLYDNRWNQQSKNVKTEEETE